MSGGGGDVGGVTGTGETESKPETAVRDSVCMGETTTFPSHVCGDRQSNIFLALTKWYVCLNLTNCFVKVEVKILRNVKFSCSLQKHTFILVIWIPNKYVNKND